MSTDTGSGMALADPSALEDAYRRAVRAGAADAFAADMQRRWQAAPGDPLLAAWHYRLQAGEERAEGGAGQWRKAIGVAIVLAMVYAVLTSKTFDQANGGPPLFFVVWAPLAACALLAYFMLVSGARKRIWEAVLPLLVLTAYAAWVVMSEGVRAQHYSLLAMLHLPVLAWAAVGWHLMGAGLDDENRFAFLHKSVELLLTGGIFVGAAGVFAGITFGLFAAIGINIGMDVQRLVVAFVAGFVPLVAAVVVYDPREDPIRQRFDQGLSRLIGAVGRVLLPFTLMVGAAYIVGVLFNFSKPFEQRDVLIVYNVMLFAIMALIVICTPLPGSEAGGTWLRRGLMLLAAMTVLVSVYALSATVYRTWLGGFTMNRITIIGWNTINIALLCVYLALQARAGQAGWKPAAYRAIRLGMVAYAIWAAVIVLAMPFEILF